MADETHNKTILLVDDDREVLAAMKTALGDLDAEVLTAMDGDDAVHQAETRHPDVVVLDIGLPKRSGFLVMEKLRKGRKKGEAPRVVMVTGNRGSRHRVYAQSLGVDDYLDKPFRMERLVESVRKLLGDEQS